MTLEEAQKQVDSWIKEYGVRYFSIIQLGVVLCQGGVILTLGRLILLHGLSI